MLQSEIRDRLDNIGNDIKLNYGPDLDIPEIEELWKIADRLWHDLQGIIQERDTLLERIGNKDATRS